MLIALLVGLTAACQPVRPVDENGIPVQQDMLTSAASELSGSTTDIGDGSEVASPVEGGGAAADNEALVERGLEVYHQQYCGVCHELQAAETTGVFGPAHNGVATTALERLKDPRYQGKAVSAAEYLHESLVEPGAYVVEGYVGTSHAMPPYTHLPEEDLYALVAFLLTQK